MTAFPFHGHHTLAEDDGKWCPHCGGPLAARRMLADPVFDDGMKSLAVSRPDGGRRYIPMTPSEWAILCALRAAWQPDRKEGRLLTRAYLLSVLPTQSDPDIKIIDVHLSAIRPKLALTPFAIGTMWGHGVFLKFREDQ